ncbi:hypothetical protein WICMUC_003764 [Wickerhamomyces mucosus]|uniref:Initiation-specific alpha-1,6-mannosyltransferase n=1 Tax=Wickerhamomyces mucosus TaxID=1378264 RepID=A0A9P8PL70_9ASCO|nr:hypothetical protein WICMUC_003764 [Wickerhamomyces mucosus]
MGISEIQKFLEKNKRAKTGLFATILIFIIYQLNSSIYGVSKQNSQYSSNLPTSDSKKSSIEIFNTPVVRLTDESSLREQLHYQFAYRPNEPLPKYIWQTWKVHELEDEFPEKFKAFTKEWKELSEGYVYQLIPDSSVLPLLEKLYASTPRVIQAYKLLPKPILKADFFRYLLLFAMGGIYSDIDTVLLKNPKEWVSFNETIYNEPNNVGLVIGIEADPDRPDWNTYYANRVQFCQWTIQAKKGHPALGEIIAQIVEKTLKKHYDGTIDKVVGKDAGDDIMNWTGPGLFTDSLFKYFNAVKDYKKDFRLVNPIPPNKYNKNSDDSNEIDWKFFTLMDDNPVLFDDVLILPITSFSPGVGHMGSKKISDPTAYVRHMFEGSWKPEDEKHIGKDQKRGKKNH